MAEEAKANSEKIRRSATEREQCDYVFDRMCRRFEPGRLQPNMTNVTSNGCPFCYGNYYRFRTHATAKHTASAAVNWKDLETPPVADEARCLSEKTRSSATGWSNATIFLTGRSLSAAGGRRSESEFGKNKE